VTRTALLAALLLLPAAAGAAARLTGAAGRLVRQRASSTAWTKAADGDTLAKGDRLRTGADARAAIVFDDGSRVELGPNSLFVLQEAEPKSAAMQLKLGSLRAKVAKIASRRFEVRTPTAVCAVRGTEFTIGVDARGGTDVRMFSGLMSVSDGRGRETMVREHQSIRVTDKGLGPVEGQAEAPDPAAPQDSMSLIRGGGDYSEGGAGSSPAAGATPDRAGAVRQEEPNCPDNACCARKCAAAGGQWRDDSCVVADVEKMHRIGCGAYRPQ